MGVLRIRIRDPQCMNLWVLNLLFPPSYCFHSGLVADFCIWNINCLLYLKYILFVWWEKTLLDMLLRPRKYLHLQLVSIVLDVFEFSGFSLSTFILILVCFLYKSAGQQLDVVYLINIWLLRHILSGTLVCGCCLWNWDEISINLTQRVSYVGRAVYLPQGVVSKWCCWFSLETFAPFWLYRGIITWWCGTNISFHVYPFDSSNCGEI